MLDSRVRKTCIEILQEELLCATGCTEPIAVAYGAATMREILGAVPERILAEVSGNILKNVKSVIVPNTGGLRGMRAAVAAGVIAGRADRGLEVIAEVPKDQYPAIASFMKTADLQVICPDTPRMLDIRLTGWKDDKKAVVHIANSHTNIVYMEAGGEVLLQKDFDNDPEDGLADKSVLDLPVILEFAETVDNPVLTPLLARQISCNRAIADEGLKNRWGAAIGSMLLEQGADDIRVRAMAFAAAGSDARMSGCDMPVVITAGSGNQGITASLPVIQYAEHLGLDEERLHRALIISDLVTVWQKRGIGRLSAYCGAVCSGAGSAAAIAWMEGCGQEVIANTILNTVSILSGMICDGAKESCAAKIAASVHAGLMGLEMAQRGCRFQAGDGIVGEDAAQTVANVGILASQGMKQTDRVILDIMNSSC